MRKLVIVFILLIGLQLSASRLTRSINEFSFDLMQKADNGENLLLSPYSVHKALAMTALGAKGDTRKEMYELLYRGYKKNNEKATPELDKLLKKNAGNKVIWQQANSIWVDNDLKIRKRYAKKLQKYFNSEINIADFQGSPDIVLDKINNWVSKNTNEKIPSILDRINPLDRMVLCNAVYFLGDWEYPFKERVTHDEDFILADGSRVAVPFMQQTESFGYFEDDDYQALCMPYKESELAMMVVLPKENDDAALKAIDIEVYEMLADSLKEQKVKVVMPKFKLEYEREMNDDLIALGMPTAFSNDANFKGISKTTDLMISLVKHKAFIEVNEKGTEAAAATAVVMKMMAVFPPKNPVEFKADHPFMFLLMDRNTQTILFSGILQDPR